ncbi:MAG TPA: tRNA 2-thiouridine(34) synthase MnmA [Chlorobaculum sp.]|uniref:tRNA-specific 2-thiouridylase MnmA n=1 Tax=Chlorobaculum tepidum (strain ATCC 49652 / DSM 12025 / NBRC 103806 / TLS) TaxID=194439 RepID=MNMA_CHLTE|nr:tRNA 2-thiouridine(34) synthase MnmA [Chlorobaculum tepidum]Q8KBD3.1 RecName: Full=tRNA-specific 2-thiouridylase MnmA [Chlorobaculum tepidum TLS]AAM73075.1 tRNA (5-methylaminomethyl-2-thiouridylate)-methyltransferase [Chlorobaculum tepidum TLS]HBU24192.1 tRNA 2-thiouridine(34) synthase MnmA [Chlorobaculum sp.]
MSSPQHVIIGLSGGVDSAVAACLLIKQGYHVTGLNIRVLDTPEDTPTLAPSAMRISDSEEFDFPVFTLNLSAKFARDVVGYFHDDYLAGRTPNPCMVCNKAIKWFGLFEAMRLLRADLVATGHYARTELRDAVTRLLKGVDPEKDQSYFLWMLTQAELAKTLFPLGGYTKAEVRELARSFGVHAAEKKESQEICFVPHDDYCAYLANAIPGLEARVAGGEIVDQAGKVIGHHRGYPFYTIGQRRGLGVSTGEPVYVTEIDAEHNRIHVGSKADLECRSLIASGMNWIGIATPDKSFEAEARIRYRDRQSACMIEPMDDNRAWVSFREPKQGVACGQAVVFYDGDEVLGGGIIAKVNPEAPPQKILG